MKAIIDIETMSTTGGFKHGELMLFTAGRRSGKSMIINQLFDLNSPMKPLPKFEIVDKADVDGATWYTVSCNPEVSAWLRSQHKEWHYEALAHAFQYPQFDVHEKLYSLLTLRWS